MVDVHQPSGALHKTERAADGAVSVLPVLVRPIATTADEDWLRDFLIRRYGNNYDVQTTEQWFRRVILPYPQIYHAMRTDNAFLMCGLRACPWTPNEFEVVVNIAAAEDGHAFELVKLFRESVAWARSRNAATWLFYSDLEENFGPFMRRIGAIERPRYTMNLRSI